MKIILGSLLASLSFASYAYEVECEGWDSDTSNWIYGTCSSGDFSGWDSETSAWVWGECEIGGSLDAWNNETGSWVWGECSDS